MPKPISLDLRKRIIARFEAGYSARASGRHFGVSESFATRLIQHWRETGSMAPLTMGRPPGRGKLVPYHGFLVETVKAEPDITMPELAERLMQTHQVHTAPATLSRLLRQLGLSYKKNAGRH